MTSAKLPPKMPLGPDGLPDLSVFSSRRNPERSAVGRVVLLAGVLLGAAVAASLGLEHALGRGRSLRWTRPGLPTALGLDAEEAPGQSSRISPEKLAELQKSWIGSESMAPRTDRVDPTTGERVGFFQGFGLQVDSSPQGASVSVNGEEMGTTPLITTVDCLPGEPVEILLSKGAADARATTRCRKDTLVKLRLRLDRPQPR
ncbi:MAG TPA: PEGA domain-containing protein [Anaeromyxobacteraceae bacterium]|nr:PEGA domain-containing protein [Anaeromyxobacteraceae bacterium]